MRREVADVYSSIRKHHAWFSESLPMIASENVMSPLARQLLVSDFVDRYAEGHPGKRYYQGVKFVDEVETKCTKLARELFKCRYADIRPISGTVSNIASFFALCEPGDTITALDTASGGHISHARFGAAGLRGLKIATYPFDPEDMTVDVKAATKVIRETRPKVAVFGASAFLFPYDLKGGLAEAAHEVGARVMYDGAHVLGLIAGGKFQDPLREGADWISASTHKTLPGPPGGIILSDRDESDEKEKRFLKRLDSASFPGTLSSHHLHQMAAKAVAFAECIEFGRQYADQIVKNSKAFAQSLHERGVKVLCEKRGFTASHQVLVDVRGHGGGRLAAKTLEDAGVICNMNMIPGDEKPMNPSGLRFGSQELTRLGMRERDMTRVAEFVVEVITGRATPDKVRGDVAEFRKGFQNIHYCYEEGLPAHKFWEFLPNLP